MLGSAAFWEECRADHEDRRLERIHRGRGGGRRLDRRASWRRRSKASASRSRPTRGWQGVFKCARARAAPYLHYRTDAEALVVTLDSDESPVHRRVHDAQPAMAIPSAAYAGFGGNVGRDSSRAFGRGRAAADLGSPWAPPFPPIEAWCLVRLGSSQLPSPLGFRPSQSRRLPYTKKELKQRLYGSHRAYPGARDAVVLSSKRSGFVAGESVGRCWRSCSPSASALSRTKSAVGWS